MTNRSDLYRAPFYDSEELRKKTAFVNDVIAENKPWTDPDFLPVFASLYDPKQDLGLDQSS
jgi:hypothetical protein